MSNNLNNNAVRQVLSIYRTDHNTDDLEKLVFQNSDGETLKSLTALAKLNDWTARDILIKMLVTNEKALEAFVEVVKVTGNKGDIEFINLLAEKNNETAINGIIEIAKAGHKDAITYVGNMADTNRKALEALVELAQTGNKHAISMLGDLARKNNETAINAFEMLGKAGNADAINCLGNIVIDSEKERVALMKELKGVDVASVFKEYIADIRTKDELANTCYESYDWLETQLYKVKIQLLKALPQLKECYLFPIIEDYIKNPSKEMFEYLVSIQEQRVLDELIEFMKTSEMVTNQNLTLGQHKFVLYSNRCIGKALNALIEVAMSTENEEAISYLGNIANTNIRAIEALIILTKVGNRQANHWLVKLGKRKSHEALISKTFELMALAGDRDAIDSLIYIMDMSKYRTAYKSLTVISNMEGNDNLKLVMEAIEGKEEAFDKIIEQVSSGNLNVLHFLKAYLDSGSSSASEILCVLGTLFGSEYIFSHLTEEEIIDLEGIKPTLKLDQSI